MQALAADGRSWRSASPVDARRIRGAQSAGAPQRDVSDAPLRGDRATARQEQARGRDTTERRRLSRIGVVDLRRNKLVLICSDPMAKLARSQWKYEHSPVPRPRRSPLGVTRSGTRPTMSMTGRFSREITGRCSRPGSWLGIAASARQRASPEPRRNPSRSTWAMASRRTAWDVDMAIASSRASWSSRSRDTEPSDSVCTSSNGTSARGGLQRGSVYRRGWLVNPAGWECGAEHAKTGLAAGRARERARLSAGVGLLLGGRDTTCRR